MRNLVLLAAGAALLAGCGANRGFDRARPDEFAVARQAPLVIPPDFALVPPQPGTARTGAASAQTQTLDALFGGAAQRSQAEASVVDQAGGAQAATGIRTGVDARTNVIDKGQTTRDIVAAPAGDGQGARAAAGGTTATPAPAATPTP